MSERAQEDLYFYNLYRGIIVEIREPIMSVEPTPTHGRVTGGALYEFLFHHFQPDMRWHVDICY